ncbi:gamma-glutamyltransferase family protein [Frigidibacter sp.]|uniref:gamma-glutamyltransferase family protein n=1 Tax=Frigidibacter sp. TaxID=2586418 RepID=UPI002734CC5D|nr:gamma-glutamyltransferase family protein [Frigidibacter sp.]MDP3339458.1 gamma-glutamyltransferase family protein [Frigidibacter sp.]
MRDFHKPGRSPVYAMNGMCATSHPLAAKTAIDILERGGNAADAALAAAMVLNIAEPQMTGLAGDCFVLLKPAGEERIVALNGSGRAPAALSADAIRAAGHATVPTAGILPVTIPGAVDAFCRLSADWGRMALADVLAPGIRYADEGIPVGPRTAMDWADDVPWLSGAARDFYLLDGQAPKPGQIFRAPGQAEVLRRIAREGRAGFYEGEVAEDLVASLQALGGVHTAEDFSATACAYTDPVSGEFRGHELVEHPPNGQGATAILMLNMLKHFDMDGLDPMGAPRAHIEAEVAKLAYDARNRFIADPDHMSRLGHMLAPETAAQLAALVDLTRALPAAAPITEAVHRDTVYVTVVDRDGMAVSLIYSVFWGFGAGIASSKFGLIFQNRGAGFTLELGHPNEAGGGKRPMHTIIPGMLKRDGRVIMPFGVMGGAFQPSGHVRFVTNQLVYGMDPQEAIDAPRCFPDAGVLKIERGYAPEVRAELEAMGHRLLTPAEPLGGAQAILIDPDSGLLTGASDPRKDGCALGY